MYSHVFCLNSAATMTTSTFFRRLAILSTAFLLIVSLAGCDAVENEESDPPPEVEGNPIELGEVDTDNIHDDFAQVAERIPDFGGFYLDENGQPKAYLLDPNSERTAEVEEALIEAFGEGVLERGDNPRRSVEDPQLELLEGTYVMQDLLEWYERTGSVFEFEETVFVDLNEQENNLTVGVENLEARESIEDRLREEDIPLEAVEIIEAEPTEIQAHDLQSSFSAAQGGIEIGQNGTSTVCTHGYVARLNGDLGFMTNSHCTQQRGSVTGTQFSNPGGGSQLGQETEDPDYQNCFFGFRSCRESDAAFVEYDAGVSVKADVARPQGWGGPNSGSGTLDIDHGSNMDVRGGKSHPVDGEVVDKVGRTTGWTWGSVQRTCVNRGATNNGNRVTVNGDPVIMKCQYTANLDGSGGDSGSPVFVWHGSEVTIVGLYWGGGGTFSTLDGIASDF